MRTIQVPVTGNEPVGDLLQPLQALAQFYRAFNRRDLALMQDNWLQTEDAAMDNPLGGIKRGWLEIETIYRAVFEGSARVNVEFHDYTLHTGEGYFYVVGRERGELVAADGTRLELKIRTSRFFIKQNGAWKQAHHHGSIDDPALLQQYQQLVRKGS